LGKEIFKRWFRSGVEGDAELDVMKTEIIIDGVKTESGSPLWISLIVNYRNRPKKEGETNIDLHIEDIVSDYELADKKWSFENSGTVQDIAKTVGSVAHKVVTDAF